MLEKTFLLKLLIVNYLLIKPLLKLSFYIVNNYIVLNIFQKQLT